WRVIRTRGPQFQMPATKVILGAVTPAADEVVIESGANHRTGNRNHSSRPFFNQLRTGFDCDTLNHLWDKAIHHLLFQQLSSQIDSGSTGDSYPEIGNLLIRVVFKAISQAQLLQSAHRDGCQDAEVRQEREHPSQSHTGALNRCHFHSGTDDVVANVI